MLFRRLPSICSRYLSTTIRPMKGQCEVESIDSLSLEHRKLADIANQLPSQITLKEGLDTSFIESILVGRFNLDLMVFSELSSKSETDELIDYLEQISDYLHSRNTVYDKAVPLSLNNPNSVTHINFPKIRKNELTSNLDENVQSKLVELGLFGLCAPVQYGGLQLSSLALTSVIETIGSFDIALATFIAAQNLWVTRAISWYGSKSQQDTYLPQLVKGEIIGGLFSTKRYMEDSSFQNEIDDASSSITDTSQMGTRGSSVKLFHPPSAQVNICQNVMVEYGGKKASLMICMENEGKPLIREMDTSSINNELYYCGLKPLKFASLAVPLTIFKNNDNALNVSSGLFSVQILDSDGFQFLAIASGALQNAINICVSCLSSETRFQKPMHSFDAVQSILGDIQTSAYVLQSLVYFISGFDHVANGRVDRSIESSLATLFGSKLVIDSFTKLMHISSFEVRKVLESDLNDIRTLMYATGQAADVAYIKDYILLSTHKILFSSSAKATILKMKAKPKRKNFEVKKRRRLLQRISELASLTDGRSSLAWIKHFDELPYRLYESVHPSLEQAAMMLEYCVYFLDTASKLTAESSCPADFFLESSFDVLCMAACISRASRSYCIGVRNADDERIMTQAFCHKTASLIRERLNNCCLDDIDQVRFLPRETFDIHDNINVPQHPYDKS